MADIIVYDSLGAPEDTASATGSLHAKIANIIAVELPKLQKPRGSIRGTFSTTVTTSFQTALSVSGKGRLTFFDVAVVAATFSDSCYIEVDGVTIGAGKATCGVIDGVAGALVTNAQFFNNLDTSNSNAFSTNRYWNGNTVTMQYQAGNGFVDISFTESLKIYVKHISNSSGVFTWMYEIEE